MPSELRELILECWECTPSKRPSFRDITLRLEKLHLKYPSAKYLFKNLSTTRLAKFNQSTSHSRKRRMTENTEFDGKYKYSKDLMNEEELSLLLLTHSNQQNLYFSE